MAKLHEVLAVMTDLETTARNIRDEAIVTFTKKATHFTGYHKTLKMFDELRKAEEEGAEDHKSLVTTVKNKLDYMKSSQVKYLDALWQQESTNQKAKADLVVGDKVIIKDAPAVFLLALESRLKAIRAVFDSAPTLDPSVEWVSDNSQGEGTYKSVHPETSQKQEKQIRHQVLVQPTKEHPAQIEKWFENVVVGTYSTIKYSGAISPGQKSDYLKKIDTLIQATKQARQRANSTQVEKEHFAKALFEYILEE